MQQNAAFGSRFLLMLFWKNSGINKPAVLLSIMFDQEIIEQLSRSGLLIFRYVLLTWFYIKI
jgi:hypothetical protein